MSRVCADDLLHVGRPGGHRFGSSPAAVGEAEGTANGDGSHPVNTEAGNTEAVKTGLGNTAPDKTEPNNTEPVDTAAVDPAPVDTAAVHTAAVDPAPVDTNATAGDAAANAATDGTSVDMTGLSAAGLTGKELVSLLTEVSLGGLSPTALVDAVVGWERVIAWAGAQQLAVLAEAARPGRVADLDSCVLMAQAQVAPVSFEKLADVDPESAANVIAAEAVKITAAVIAPLIGVARRAVADRVTIGIDLTTNLPATFAALTAGTCDLRRATQIAERTVLMCPSARSAADRELAAAASSGHNSGKLRHTIDRAMARLDPVAFANSRRRAVAGRTVTYRAGQDGMGIVTATLRAEDAVTVYHFLSALGENAAEADLGCPDPLPGNGPGLEEMPPRTAGACRADVLVTLIGSLIDTHRVDLSDLLDRCRPGTNPAPITNTTSAETAASPARPTPQQPPRRPLRPLPALNVTISLDTLAQINNNPGWLDTYGYLTADQARSIAASATTITVVALNNCGTVLDLGRRVRIPNQKLKDHIQQRDRTCRAPGCNQPANRSDIDHQQPWQPDGAGGPTCGCNLAALCRTHHLLKHRAGIAISHHSDHTITWRTHTGHIQETQPHQWDPPPF